MYILCHACQEEITEDSDFCPHCGMIFKKAGEVFCGRHETVRAAGVCIICRRLLCHRCAVRVHRRMFCDEHRHVKVQQDWAEVYRSTELNEAGMIKSVLEGAGFKVQTQNFQSVGFVWDGGGDSSQSRSNLNRPAMLLVPIPEYLDARTVVDDWLASSGTDEAENT